MKGKRLSGGVRVKQFLLQEWDVSADAERAHGAPGKAGEGWKKCVNRAVMHFARLDA